MSLFLFITFLLFDRDITSLLLFTIILLLENKICCYL